MATENPLENHLEKPAIHLIFKSAKIDNVRADENAEKFISNLIQKYNEDKKNIYKRVSLHTSRWKTKWHDEIHMEIYYCKTSLDKSNSIALVKKLSNKDYTEEFQERRVQFAYFLYFETKGSNENNSETRWNIFALTTRYAFHLVRPYCDYYFRTKIAYRLVDPKFYKVESKRLIGAKEGDISMYRKPFNLRLNSYFSLWILYKNFDGTVKRGSSLHRVLDLPENEKIHLHVGVGMVRIGRELTLAQYLENVLPLLFQISQGGSTEKLDGTCETNDSAFEVFSNIRRINASEKQELDRHLIGMIWEAVKSDSVSSIPFLYLSHRLYHQYYASTRLKLQFKPPDNISNQICKRMFKCYWEYRPTLEELIKQLRHWNLDKISVKDFEIAICSVSVSTDTIRRKCPLLQYIQGQAPFQGNIYYRMEGSWLEASNQHLAATERSFLKILDNCLATENNKKGHLLPYPWISKEKWVSFSFLDVPEGISRKDFEYAIIDLTNIETAIIDDKKVVRMAYPVRALLDNQTQSTCKKLKKRWEELRAWLNEYLDQNVEVSTLETVFEDDTDKFFKLLQKPFHILDRNESEKEERIAPITNDGIVQYSELSKLAFSTAAPETIKKNIEDLSKFLSENEKVTKDDLEKVIPNIRYRNVAYKWLQRKHELSKNAPSRYRYLMRGPVPEELLTKDNEKALRAFLEDCHQKYSQVMDEEQYNRCYLNHPDYLVFDQIFPGGREQIELFDLLYKGDDEELPYAVKEEFGNSTGIACNQIRVAMKALTSAIQNSGHQLLHNLYNKVVNTEPKSDFRVRAKERLEEMTAEDFVNLFIERKIVFVYAFLDTNDADRRMESDLELIQEVTEEVLQKADIDKPQQVLQDLQVKGYLDETSKLTDKFLREKEEDFKGTINVPGLYKILMRNCSLYKSLIGKLEIIELFHSFKKTEFEFQIQQLDRPGKVVKRDI
ncbi:uncharacterized protein TRIADDRAFT_56955 [Trichoplax adhaerens]|uniref:Uncharacterized protein n=1 Tax=Trichoplax adhaerens TaxID=10228 RepID=B3RX11_TRIAD|nr:hypothetical protein TRIADDRAFT_56955 [Trichoplax adhaerens]EDV24790.1 hypothetical protein TRIADDRAFT_56955 [Trichoplax adhaerens]|eukprot:XP_002112680.1 hypothetical protein TRIADDRAFT_56955 [Trichoplax adhaerens]